MELPDQQDQAAARAQRRRPVGFHAPGPVPSGAQGQPDLWPGPDEDLSFLSGDWRIFQRRRGHRWSLDDLLTAAVALQEAERIPDLRRALDMGCGIGSVLMTVAWGLPQARVDGVEAQELSVALLRRSLRYNGAAGRCAVHLGDLRDEALVPAGAYDLVTGTPPYLPPGQGVVSQREQRGPCCFELRGGVEDYLRAGARALRPGGSLVLCAGALPPGRVEAEAPRLGLLLRRRVAVEPRAGKPVLFFVYALSRAEAPAADPVTERFLVRDAAGRPTAQIQAVRRALGMPAL